MLRHRVWAALLGGVVLCLSSLARAECTKDTDCEGDRVCEAGQCLAPQPAPPPAAVAAPAPTPAPAPATSADLAARPTIPSPSRAPVLAQPLDPLPPVKRPRRSRGMMAGGIVMVSVGPLMLGVAAIVHSREGCADGSDATDGPCETRTEPSTYLLAISGALLVAGGVPMIVYGAKRVPAGPPLRAAVVPWATPEAAGLRLRLEL